MASVILNNVSKIYPGGVRAVDDVSLEIADREFVVLVGPSGCGKSTTLRMVAGLEEISSGTIQIGNRVVNDVAPKDRNIAMVFQNYALYPHMSVYRNMAFGLMLRREHAMWDNPIGAIVAPARRAEARRERENIDRRVRDAADMLGITHLLDRKPGQLSGGQRQRVAVGRAIVREPQAYLFDEPLSNLDAKLRVEMRAEIKRLHRRVNTTTIYVTHDQEEAMTLGDRVVVMKDGVIQQQDSPFVTYEHPVNRFVAGFVGTPPMNFLAGSLEQCDGRLCFVERAANDKASSAPSSANRLNVAARHVDRLADRVGKPITLGVRPDQLEPAGEEAAHNVLQVRVGVVEPLGERMDVHLSTALHPALTSRIDARRSVREGKPARFAVDMDRVHYFATEGDEPNLTLPK